MARDIESTFGKITCSATGVGVAAPNCINEHKGQLGRRDALYVKFKLGTKAIAAADTVTFTILQGTTTTPAEEAAVVKYTGKAYPIGYEFRVKLPVDHKQYLGAKAAVTSSSAVSQTFDAYLERG